MRQKQKSKKFLKHQHNHHLSLFTIKRRGISVDVPLRAKYVHNQLLTTAAHTISSCNSLVITTVNSQLFNTQNSNKSANTKDIIQQ